MREKKKKKTLPDGLRHSALPLTDWNIPQRGLASLLQDSCLSARRKNILTIVLCLFIIEKRGLCACGYFVHLQDNFISFLDSYVRLPVSLCKSNKHFFCIIYLSRHFS